MILPGTPEVIELWNRAYPLFQHHEMSCPCCGEVYLSHIFMDMMVRARELAGIPFSINSGHRCRPHNESIPGSAKYSQHLTLAADIAVNSANRFTILKALYDAGFRTFGLANGFIHVDLREDKMWFYGQSSKRTWVDTVKEFPHWPLTEKIMRLAA